MTVADLEHQLSLCVNKKLEVRILLQDGREVDIKALIFQHTEPEVEHVYYLDGDIR